MTTPRAFLAAAAAGAAAFVLGGAALPVPASAAGSPGSISVDSAKAVAAPSGSSLEVSLTYSCPANSTVRTGFIRAEQDGKATEGLRPDLPVTCDGRPHTGTWGVPGGNGAEQRAWVAGEPVDIRAALTTRPRRQDVVGDAVVATRRTLTVG
ncbi:hypothetical protein [Kitasatospora sp. McL0602]|uniref:hypothetical protein n=1 Tax=Kitasatospora sp. McL0602 TaxID=3439530 RepID=UPI003F897FC5